MRKLLFIFISAIALNSSAQRVADTCMNIPLISAHFGGHIPYGDLEKRFGNGN